MFAALSPCSRLLCYLAGIVAVVTCDSSTMTLPQGVTPVKAVWSFLKADALAANAAAFDDIDWSPS